VEFEQIDQSPTTKNPIQTKVEQPITKQDKYKYNSVDLPSEGKLGYSTEVRYRDILVKDEKEISSATEHNFQPILNKIISGLLEDSTFYKEMSIYDRDFLILWIWANNYSTHKDLEYTCPHCETHNKESVDLTKIPVSPISDSYVSPYKYTLSNGEDIVLRLITVRDEEIATNFVKNNKQYDEAFIMLCLSIDFKTKMPLKEKMKYIEDNMTGKDMSKIRGFHKHFKYGIDDSIELECSGCGEVNKTNIPFQVDFFLPTLSGDFE